MPRVVLRAENAIGEFVEPELLGAAELDDHSLTPGTNPRIAPTRFEDWLSQSTGVKTL